MARRVSKWIRDNIDDDVLHTSIFKFEVTTDIKIPQADGSNIFKTVTVDAMPDANLDEDRLEEELAFAPSQYQFYHGLYSTLRYQSTVAQLSIKAKKRNLTATILEQYRENGVKLTQDQLDYLVSGDPDIIKLEKAHATLERGIGKLFGLLHSLDMKSDNGRSLLASKRRSMENC